MRHRACVIAAIFCLGAVRPPAQTAPQPTLGPQPGLAWTDAELIKVAHHVRGPRRSIEMEKKK